MTQNEVVFSERRGVGVVDQLRYGTNEIGKPRWSGNSWYRVDLYRRASDGEVIPERHFAAGSGDYSPVFYRDVNGKYDADCPSCYLNFPHTLAEHERALREHARSVAEHAARQA